MAQRVSENWWILTGPTGSGKTAISLELAERLGAEIISMDSMALYRGMDVGTAKPTIQERQRVPHHLIDVLEPWETASVAWWLKRAHQCARDIEGRGKRVLFVGGTALYLKALLYGLFEGPPADEAMRRTLAEEARTLGGAALHGRLAAVDPVSARRLHPNDVRRVIRALEVWHTTGKPMSEWQQQWSSPTPESLRAWWIDLPRQELYARIEARVQRMMEAGLVEEVERLRRLPRGLSREAAKALGYREILEHLEGRMTLQEAVERIQVRSRNFAKRQLTWFRNLTELQPLRGELTAADLLLRMDT